MAEEVLDLMNGDLRQIGIICTPAYRLVSLSDGTAISFSSPPPSSSMMSTPTIRQLIIAPGTMARVLATITSHGSPSSDSVWGMKP